MNQTQFVGHKCIIRTYSAGVHFGTLESIDGKAAVLVDARRIWQWYGANTLNEIAATGVAAKSRISNPVPCILLTEAIEVIPVTDDAAKSLESVGWSK